jgi:Fur family ferric uptake transcriptional regulator
VLIFDIFTIFVSIFFIIFAPMLDHQACEALLTEHGIKPTANRIVVVKTLADAERPLSLSELEYQILSIDKSGVFRALTLFREHHLVHVIEDGGDGVRYELCRSHHGHDDDDDQHVHFYCERCHRTFCLHDMPIPTIILPDGYQLQSINYMAKGLCPDCAAL